MSVEQFQYYQHFKGSYYQVTGLAKHSETEEVMVIYTPARTRDALWVRPLAMFEEVILLPDGSTGPRFKLVDALQVQL